MINMAHTDPECFFPPDLCLRSPNINPDKTEHQDQTTMKPLINIPYTRNLNMVGFFPLFTCLYTVCSAGTDVLSLVI